MNRLWPAALKFGAALIVVMLHMSASVEIANAKTDLKGLKLLHAVAPEYPPVARRYNIQGIVIAQLTIGTDGRVGKTEIIESPADVLSQAVERATPQWLFAKPEARTVIMFDLPFRLTKTGENAFVFSARTLVEMPRDKSELGKKIHNGWADVRIVLTGDQSRDFYIAKSSDPAFRKTVEQIIERLRFSEGVPAVNALKIRVTDDAPLLIELLPGE